METERSSKCKERLSVLPRVGYANHEANTSVMAQTWVFVNIYSYVSPAYLSAIVFHSKAAKVSNNEWWA